MNFKLEKFWNFFATSLAFLCSFMNFKLEKFWNVYGGEKIWQEEVMNFKLEKFWNFKWFGFTPKAAANEL